MFNKTQLWVVFLILASSASMWAQQPVPSCSVTISLTSDNVKTGSPIIVKAMVSNITKHTVTLAHEMGHRAEYEFKVIVRDTDGNLAPMTRNGHRFWRDDADRIGDWIDESLEPGKSVIEHVDLGELYDLKPGVYRVQLSQGDLLSNIISLTVVP